ncbi:MAG: helix-turn-helix domain-containing protein [Rhodobacteraceae bacterium]|nr:helix-turn-helix domain-containing protein [Paracoccaceae bacterium]PHR54764.1 MAG: AraC family transcriptional regulator [Robiginitomaculum sp.]
MHENERTEIGFLIFPGFPMACLTSIIEPLRAANEIAGVTAFVWRMISETGARVTSSAEVVFEPSMALDAVEALDQLFLLSSPVAVFENAKAGNGALRRLARHGAIIGGISGGVFPLARSGLLDQHICSVHWCYGAAFHDEFPDLQMSDEVIMLDGRRHTVSGAAAGFDLALHLIEERLGDDVATEVACWFQHPLMRGQGVRQRIPTRHRASADDMLPPQVKSAIEIFAAHMATPVTIAEVAQMAGLSTRQLDRAFNKATGKGPLHYYRSMRMKAARQLVQYSNNPMRDVAAAVGYMSATPLMRHYHQEFGVSPDEDRAKINMFRVQQNKAVPSSERRRLGD